MTSGDHTKGHTELPSVIWMRDLDGTGSMHPCAKGDPGAITYVPEDSVNTYPAVAELVKALEDSTDLLQEMVAGFIPCSAPNIAQEKQRDEQVEENRSALTRFREAQAGGGA